MSSSVNILIVDDNKAARDSLDMLLSSEGYELNFSDDGRKAIDFAKKHHPDVVLLDIMMPEMDGYEVCRHIRQEELIREVPVILITALDDRESRLRGIRAGADDFISKPFDRSELRLKIRNITALNRYRAITNARGRFKWLADASEDAAVIVNAADVIQYANKAARIYFSLPDDQGATELRFLDTVRRGFNLEPGHLWSGWPDNLAETAGQTRYFIRPETDTMKSVWFEVRVLEQYDVDMMYIVRMKNVTKQVHNWRDNQLLHNTLSHKLHSSLTNVLGGLSLLAEDRPDQQANDAPALTKMSSQGIIDLQNVIAEILSYTDARSLLLREPKCTVGRMVEIAQELAHNVGIETLLVTCEETLRSAVLDISEDAMRHILLELAENAKKFHPIRQAVVRLRAEITEERMVNITYSDDGISIAPEELQKVWEPYYQSEAVFQRDAKGLGLGLAFVRTLILSVGGACDIQNLENGAGVLIALTVPLL